MSLKKYLQTGLGIGLSLLLESGCATPSTLQIYDKQQQEEKSRESEEGLGASTLLNFKDDSYITTLQGSKELMTILELYTGEIELRKKKFGTTTYPIIQLIPRPYNDALKRILVETDENKDKILTLEEISTLQKKVGSKTAKEHK